MATTTTTRVAALAFACAMVAGPAGCGDEGAAGAAAGGSGAGGASTCSVDSDCDDGAFCNGLESCSAGACAKGQAPCDEQSICVEHNDSCEPIDLPGGDGLPVGIPEPDFGYGLDTDADATIYVDNTNPACDNAVGSAAQPLCDLFRGAASTSYAAGDVVHVLGGPYPIAGDLSLTMDGSEAAPVIIKGIGDERILFDGGGARVDFAWDGSYGAVENIAFFHKTRHVVDGDHLLFRNIGVTNPIDALIDFNPVVNLRGHDLIVQASEIGNNRRDNDTDSHGIQAGEGSYNLWILESEIYNNNGDGFQGCHQCFAAPPHHVYIGRNILHEDRENAVDLKTIHDVVVSENLMYGYGSSATSGGDAMVVGSNGFDDATNMGPRRIWILHNEMRQSSRALRIEGSEDVWVIGNVMTDVNRGLQIDDKSHRLIVVAANTITQVTDGMGMWGCAPTTLTVLDNIIAEVAERHVDFSDCDGGTLRLDNNLLFNPGGGLAVRVGGTNYTDLSTLHGESFASSNLEGDPLFGPGTRVPEAGSPAIDAGAALDSVYDDFLASFGTSIASDRAGTVRPSGAAEDMGAYEVP